MFRTNICEMGEMVISSKTQQHNEKISETTECQTEEKLSKSTNQIAKREMATELLLQGFTEKAICRILNISPNQMPEPLPF